MVICVKCWGGPELFIVDSDGGCMSLFANAFVNVATFGITNLLRPVVRIVGQAIRVNLWIDNLGSPDVLN